MNLVPYVFSVLNFLNSFPDDDQVHDLLCPAPQFTTTVDGVQHKLNRGYCEHLMDVMIADGETSIWKKRFIGLGYDGIVRRWNCEEDVDRMKGYPLFCKDGVASVNPNLSLRDLASYGFEDDCEWTAGVENCLLVSVLGKPAPLVFSCKDESTRDLFVNYLTDCCVCGKQSNLQN